MKILVGLGNPGKEYERTPHNAGFITLDLLAVNLRGLGYVVEDWHEIKKEKSILSEVFSGDGRRIAVLVKPQTYMNLSGESVQPLMAYYNIPRENLLVLSDDVHLNFGRARLRAKGSSGGQKGIQNIIQRLGSDEFARLRMGVGPFPQGRDMANFVLDRLPKPQLEALPEYMGVMADTVERCIQNGVEATIPFANGYRLPGFEN